jgi:hypothetical protein
MFADNFFTFKMLLPISEKRGWLSGKKSHETFAAKGV